MNDVKRFGVVAMVFLLGVLFAAFPAHAAKPGKSSTTVTQALVPPKIDPPEGRARGSYRVTFDDRGELVWAGVSCWRLTPMKQYHIVVWSDPGPGWLSFPVSADGDGNLIAGLWGAPDHVRLENDEGQVVLTER